eukprot:TRINITY_DN3310_c1_g1_i9.p1 TRINITY_DN3310_c1_g1~~TRINITY_DN3310_c1_g1_i9.p1  ORF type:complete len:282 (-),score=69.16 TRINITY_DN3310_c1_g1_i9:940-1758(-)
MAAFLLKNYDIDLNLGKSPLFVCCQENNLDFVKTLLEMGADVNSCNINGASSLYIACELGHFEIVKYLLIHGADVNLCFTGYSPLYISAYHGHLDIIKMLLDHGADVNKRGSKRHSPFSISAYHGHLDIAMMLLDHPEINVNGFDMYVFFNRYFMPIDLWDAHKESSEKLYINVANFGEPSTEGDVDVTFYHVSQSQLIELVKNQGYLISTLVLVKAKSSLIRQFVTSGVYMNQMDFGLVINTCWDLVDINKKNGGNMHQYIDENADESDDD